MKLLMIYMNRFSYKPTIKAIGSVPDFYKSKEYENIQAAFIQAEKEDVENESKADPEFTKALFDNIDERLTSSGFIVDQTPFGYFLDLNVEAPGFSLARVFKEF